MSEVKKNIIVQSVTNIIKVGLVYQITGEDIIKRKIKMLAKMLAMLALVLAKMLAMLALMLAMLALLTLVKWKWR